jgi:hypothetical protein
MIPVDQTIIYGPESNCLGACIASVLELGLSEVPGFGDFDGDWFADLEEFLARFDLQPLRMGVPETRDYWTPAGYHLTFGWTQRGTWHSVVGWAGEMVHDPHPDKSGLLEEVVWVVFVSKRPRR